MLSEWIISHNKQISCVFWVALLIPTLYFGVPWFLGPHPIDRANVCVTTPDGEVCGRDTSGRSW